jgi:putative effector of murein hydrolase
MKSSHFVNLLLLLALVAPPPPSLGFSFGSTREQVKKTPVGGSSSKRPPPPIPKKGAKWRPFAPLSTTMARGTNKNHPVSALSASTTTTSSSRTSMIISKRDVQAVLSASAFFVMDIATRRLFRYLKLTMFPPSLVACFVLFLAQIWIMPKRVTDDWLSPGAQLLAKWLPVFFVPSLITLPLADTAQLELVKVAILVSVGFIVSLLSTAGTVVFVRRNNNSNNSNNNNVIDIKTTTVIAATAATRPFSNRLVQLLTLLTVATGLFNTVISVNHHPTGQGAYLVLATLTSFVYGSQLNSRIKSILHPLVTCTALTWAAIQVLVVSSSSSFAAGLRLYQTTAGSLLLKCLGPAVVSLACSMYARRMLMRDNWKSIVAAITTSTITGLLGTAIAVRWLTQTSAAIRLSLLSRNITSPLAMAIAGMLNADVSLAVSIVVVTGLLGANFGATILSLFGITDPVARGLAVGAAAHGLGTAAMVNEKEAFPLAGAAMALSAFAATITVAIPPVRNLLIRIAMG